MMLVAEIPGFLKTFVIIIGVYFLIRFLGKLLWPYVVKYITRKASEKMQNVFKGFQQQNQSTQAVHKDVPKKTKEVVGEYIDYEEVD